MNICPECGTDPFKGKDYDKVTQEKLEIASRFRKASAQFGIQRAEWEMREIELIESRKWLQRKIKKQAEAITKLEAKLKGFGQQPYQEQLDSAKEITGM
jgi:hypothetical protein